MKVKTLIEKLEKMDPEAVVDLFLAAKGHWEE